MLVRKMCILRRQNLGGKIFLSNARIATRDLGKTQPRNASMSPNLYNSRSYYKTQRSLAHSTNQVGQIGSRADPIFYYVGQAM